MIAPGALPRIAVPELAPLTAVQRRADPAAARRELEANAAVTALVRLGGAEERAAAYTRIYETLWDDVWNYCYGKLGNPTDAQDAAQDAFAKLHRKVAAGDVDAGTNWQAFAYRIAANVCIDLLRHNGVLAFEPLERRLAAFVGRSQNGGVFNWTNTHGTGDRERGKTVQQYAPLATEHDRTANPAAALDDAETSAELRALLEALPPRRRAMLVLQYWHGLTLPEIAAAMGTTLNAVKCDTFRARNELRERVRFEGARRRWKYRLPDADLDTLNPRYAS